MSINPELVHSNEIGKIDRKIDIGNTRADCAMRVAEVKQANGIDWRGACLLSSRASSSPCESDGAS